MKFGNAAWGFRETPLEEQFKITADMGLSFLEIGIANAPDDMPLDVTNEKLLEIKVLAERYGINIFAAATGNDFTTGVEDIPKIKRVIDICNTLRIPYLRIFAGFTPLSDVTDDTFKMMIESLIVVCNYADENGVVPVIETHGGVNCYDDGVEHIMSTTTDIGTLKAIINKLPNNARICFDPANLYAVGIKQPELFYSEIKDKVAYAHFKDFEKLSSGHLKPSFCGDSDMNWDLILKSMEDFEGIAVFEYENVYDIKEGLEKSLKFIKENSHV